MTNILYTLTIPLASVGLLFLTRRIFSLRLRFTLNGALIGLGLGALWLGPVSSLFQVFTVSPSAQGFEQLLVWIFISAMLGGVTGAIYGIRLDGTRYLFSRVRRVCGEIKWFVIHHLKTSQNAKKLMTNHAISDRSKTLILFYNSMFGAPLPLDDLELPEGCAITTDRRYRSQASAVVFHIPTLRNPYSLPHCPGQLRVAWFMESAVQHPILNDMQFMKQFDLTMSFRRDADVWAPYCFPVFDQLASTPMKSKSTENLIAFFFSYLSERSGRNTYVREFMRHIDAHSYGRFLRNRTLPKDLGRETKLQVLSRYKFNLAYENSIERDYVTEKFYDPLEVGCVPVYMGAPNIDAYAPGDHCYINAADFDGPRALAEYLLALNEDAGAYHAYHAWRSKSARASYARLYEKQRVHPFVRLCELLQQLQSDSKALRKHEAV